MKRFEIRLNDKVLNDFKIFCREKKTKTYQEALAMLLADYHDHARRGQTDMIRMLSRLCAIIDCDDVTINRAAMHDAASRIITLMEAGK